MNPITQTILLDDIPVQCKNYSGAVTSLKPIDDLERCTRNSKSHVIYLFILGQLSNDFLQTLRLRAESLSRELGRPVAFEVVGEDRIAELYAAYFVTGGAPSNNRLERTGA